MDVVRAITPTTEASGLIGTRLAQGVQEARVLEDHEGAHAVEALATPELVAIPPAWVEVAVRLVLAEGVS